MRDIHTGSCLCGAVQFQIKGAFDSFYFCHCTRCQKVSGSAHAANLFSNTATLSWLNGVEKVKTYVLAGTRFDNTFCTDCGAALPVQNKALMVPAGSLDVDVTTRPTAHIYHASRGNWEDAEADTPVFEEQPE